MQHLLPGDADVETTPERGSRASSALQVQGLLQDMPQFGRFQDARRFRAQNRGGGGGRGGEGRRQSDVRVQLLQLREHEQVDASLAHQQETLEQTYEQTKE